MYVYVCVWTVWMCVHLCMFVHPIHFPDSLLQTSRSAVLSTSSSYIHDLFISMLCTHFVVITGDSLLSVNVSKSSWPMWRLYTGIARGCHSVMVYCLGPLEPQRHVWSRLNERFSRKAASSNNEGQAICRFWAGPQPRKGVNRHILDEKQRTFGIFHYQATSTIS